MSGLCQKTGCAAPATHAPMIRAPYHRLWPDEAPLEIVIGLEACRAHLEEPGFIVELLAGAADLLKGLNRSGLKGGRPALDLPAASVVAIELADPRYQVLKGAPSDDLGEVGLGSCEVRS